MGEGEPSPRQGKAKPCPYRLGGGRPPFDGCKPSLPPLNGGIYLLSAPSLNRLNLFTVRKTFGLFCFMEEFNSFTE